MTHRAQCVGICVLLHDRAGTFASLLYKAEKPSVRPHFRRIFVSRGSQPSVHVSASNLLEMKATSFGISKFVSKSF